MVLSTYAGLSPRHCSAPSCSSLSPSLCTPSKLEHMRSAPCLCQADYDKLQALYEDLKAAKIDEEVQQLLEQQNRYVSEHGQKAAALVERYKREVRGTGAGAGSALCWGGARQWSGEGAGQGQQQAGSELLGPTRATPT